MRYYLFPFFFVVCSPFLSIAQPSNDYCENAIQLDSINGGCFFDATLLNATQSLPATDCNSALVQDVWFSFQAVSSEHNVSVSPSAGMDVVVEVRKGSACNGTYIACMDMGGGNGAVENLMLENLNIDSTYWIRIYDFTGAGSPPSTWEFDICVSGFLSGEPPEIQLISPNGGELIEAGKVLKIQAGISGIIAAKEIEFSADNGANWERIWQSNDGQPTIDFDWIVPSINATQCLIRVTVFQGGEVVDDVNDIPFSIFIPDHPVFSLNQALSHLYWPFYNPALFPAGDFHVPSQWQNQEEGILITSEGVVNTWFYLNDHYWQSSGRWHHSGDNCFAQDWNFINGGNSDCQMYFFSPMEGKILFKKDACFNELCGQPTCTSGCGNYIAVQSTIDPTFAYRACHFSELNAHFEVGDVVEAGDYIARIGNEGSSSAAHVHFVLYKNLTPNDIEILSTGGTLNSNTNPLLDPENPVELCFNKAANFRFDVALNNQTTHLPPVAYEPYYQIHLYPNPNEGQFSFSVNGEARQFFEITVFDPIGRLVYKEKRKNYFKEEVLNLDINGSNPGIYLLQLKFDQEILRKRFILSKP